MVTLLDVLGYVAGLFTMIAFLPQVIRVWKTKSTKDISLATFCLFCTGVFLWLIYGLFIKLGPVVITNAVIFVLAAVILIFKLKYK